MKRRAATAHLKDEFNAKQGGMSKFDTVLWPSLHF